MRTHDGVKHISIDVLSKADPRVNAVAVVGAGGDAYGYRWIQVFQE